MAKGRVWADYGKPRWIWTRSI